MLSQFMHGFAEDAHSGLKMVNLFLFGLLLCRFVHRRGDIWYAVGIHGAAVGLIRVVSNLSDRVGDRSPWIGHSAKFDDGWLLTVLLGMALVVCEWVRSPSEDPNRVSF